MAWRRDATTGARGSIPGRIRPLAGLFGGSSMTFPLVDRGSQAPRSESGPEQFTKESILRDYGIAYQSREASLVGEKQVFSGKAKFGIFGAGKEVAQVALARAFRPGDFRSGYYRDQTLMMALGLLS